MKEREKSPPKVESGNYILSYVLKVSKLINCNGHSLVGKTPLQTILLRSEGLAGLIESNIPPEEVALFINSIDLDPPRNASLSEFVRSVLSNPHLHILIAMEAKLRDEDAFYQEWLVERYTVTYSRKESIVM